MKNPFKADTRAALDKTRRKLTDVEANIAALEVSRAEKLRQTDDVDEIRAVNKAIEAERNAAEIYKSRIAILEEQARGEVYASREGDLGALRRSDRIGLDTSAPCRTLATPDAR